MKHAFIPMLAISLILTAGLAAGQQTTTPRQVQQDHDSSNHAHDTHLADDGNPDSWLFPSEALSTPVGRDNLWRRNIEPKLKEIKLDWGTFQIMRRTHASLSRKAGIDPKLVADQLGHGIGVNLDTYTIADLEQRLAAVNTLEQSLASTAIH